MSNTEDGKSTFEKLLQPAIVSFRTGVWLGEAAFSGVNRIVPLTKFGRNIVHTVDEARLVNYRRSNATKIEKEMLKKDFEERPNDNKLTDLNTLRYSKVSLIEAGEQVEKAVLRLDPEVHIAEVAQVLEESGVAPRTIEIAVARARDNLPQTTAPELVDLREDPTNRITTVTLE